MDGIDLQEGAQGVHKKRFSEPTRPGNQTDKTAGFHQRFEDSRFVDVVAVVFHQADEGFITDGKRFYHSAVLGLVRSAITESITMKLDLVVRIQDEPQT